MRPLPANWVQCNDNSIDPVHFEHLHGYFGDYWNRKHGIDKRVITARHLKIEFDVFEYGIYKRRLVEGEPEDADDWTVGHPFIFPHTLVQGVGDPTAIRSVSRWTTRTRTTFAIVARP
jgi:5,5'-dehydrodivanillate O-demethylase